MFDTALRLDCNGRALVLRNLFHENGPRIQTFFHVFIPRVQNLFRQFARRVKQGIVCGRGVAAVLKSGAQSDSLPELASARYFAVLAWRSASPLVPPLILRRIISLFPLSA